MPSSVVGSSFLLQKKKKQCANGGRTIGSLYVRAREVGRVERERGGGGYDNRKGGFPPSLSPLFDQRQKNSFLVVRFWRREKVWRRRKGVCVNRNRIKGKDWLGWVG